MEPEDTHVHDQLDGYAGSAGRRLGIFYTEAIGKGAPPFIAAVGALLWMIDGWFSSDR